MKWLRERGGDVPRLWVQGLGAVLTGLVLALENRGGYVFPVFDSIKALMSWTRFEPLTVWGVIFVGAGALVLSGSRKAAMVGLLILVGAWGAFAGGILLIGAVAADVAMLSGAAYLTIALGSLQRLIELAGEPPAKVKAP